MNIMQKWTPIGTNRWDPFKDMDTMRDRLSQVLGLAALSGNGGNGGGEGMSLADWIPPVDITEDDHEYLIEAELPEVKKEDVTLKVDNGVLSIAGERKFEKEEKTRKQHRMERSYGRFERSFTLPDGTDGGRVNAEFKNGVLKVHLAKNPTAKPKRIDIKVN